MAIHTQELVIIFVSTFLFSKLVQSLVPAGIFYYKGESLVLKYCTAIVVSTKVAGIKRLGARDNPRVTMGRSRELRQEQNTFNPIFFFRLVGKGPFSTH